MAALADPRDRVPDDPGDLAHVGDHVVLGAIMRRGRRHSDDEPRGCPRLQRGEAGDEARERLRWERVDRLDGRKERGDLGARVEARGLGAGERGYSGSTWRARHGPHWQRACRAAADRPLLPSLVATCSQRGPRAYAALTPHSP